MKRELVTVSISKKGKGIAGISVKGELTIKSAEELKQKLTDVPDEFNILDLEITDISAIDLSGIQIIEGFKKTILNKKKRFTLVTKLPDELDMLISRAGIKTILTQ